MSVSKADTTILELKYLKEPRTHSLALLSYVTKDPQNLTTQKADRLFLCIVSCYNYSQYNSFDTRLQKFLSTHIWKNSWASKKRQMETVFQNDNQMFVNNGHLSLYTNIKVGSAIVEIILPDQRNLSDLSVKQFLWIQSIKYTNKKMD
jgi:hypothetical protein